ncbi:hypothetical protein MSG28_004611 [Choristoneura fumiferana]|uniref:Uncharacterized protein n=1 Tax=Choristoneura fumiferana TaxID=7141 RepID=A0ACC0K6K0_CHOFU|nr:hypothetical protein MSG28_004611 [Choristoneura fumiferana]
MCRNLDPLTETYGLSFYTQYLAHWPEYFQVAESPSGEIMGYIMGKAEGLGENWHGHVTALTVSPDYRRLGLAATLMSILEDVSEQKKAYFVDLFVRVSNKVAINMYKNLGYIVYRTVLEYYSGDPDEDAYVISVSLRFTNKTSFNSNQDSEFNLFEHLKQVIENHNQNWPQVKNTLISSQGRINNKNIDAIMLKLMVTNKKLDTALSFASYLDKTESLSLGATNGLLGLYYEIGRTKKLSDKQRNFILESYGNLYDKYKILDSMTSERLLHALCAIDECDKALKVLEDIHHTGVPSHSAYSNLIATFFRLNRRNEAVKVIQSSLNKKRPLQYIAYAEWINYILRKYKMNKTIVKHLDEICVHIARNSVTIDTATAEKLLEVYTAVGWSTQFSKIHKQSGQCNSCKETLQCLKLSMEEFHKLQNNIKEKLIVGSDLFLKTSPDELQRFQKFIEKTAPYDIVLDSLNIALAVGTPNSVQRISFLKAVVDQFKRENKRILLLGRNHMLKWPRQPLDYLRRNTFSFFTDNLSQDDPYFITAAILSGPHTDIVSKDLLRGHMFLLQDEELRHIFKRWQWQHQWMVFANKGRPQILPPLKFTPFAQKLNDGWHLPYEKEAQSTGQVNIGVPDLTNWLCLRPKQNK